MKKRINTLFFGLCFIAAILIEAYCIQILKGNLFSTFALGIVVMITGYLFMDTIRSRVKKSEEAAKFYVDHLLSNEAEKWNERYTELLNLQKASYTATKKNTVLLNKQFEDVLFKIETLEDINAKAQQKIMELQKKVMEGQKNALNLQINYGIDNTKQIIEILRDEVKSMDTKDQLSNILSLVESNNSELLEYINQMQIELPKQMNSVIEDLYSNRAFTSNRDNNIIDDEVFDGNISDSSSDNLSEDEKFLYNLKDSYEEAAASIEVMERNTKADTFTDNLIDRLSDINNIVKGAEESRNNIDSLEDSFNDNYIITDTFANNFNEDIFDTEDLAERNDENIINVEISTGGFEENNLGDYISQETIDSMILENTYNEDDYFAEDVTSEDNDNDNVISNRDTLPDDFYSKLTEGYMEEEQMIEKASETELSIPEELESEAAIAEEIETVEKPVIVPLYADPNKALSADEIAALFASFGQ